MSGTILFAIGIGAGFLLGVLITSCLVLAHLGTLDDERLEAEIRRWVEEREAEAKKPEGR